jgi:hypothetical protein
MVLGSGFAVLNETEGPLVPELELVQATKAITLTPASNSANIRLHLVILVGLINTLLEVSWGEGPELYLSINSVDIKTSKR